VKEKTHGWFVVVEPILHRLHEKCSIVIELIFGEVPDGYVLEEVEWSPLVSEDESHPLAADDDDACVFFAT
jgi:hypothetical protein